MALSHRCRVWMTATSGRCNVTHATAVVTQDPGNEQQQVFDFIAVACCCVTGCAWACQTAVRRSPPLQLARSFARRCSQIYLQETNLYHIATTLLPYNACQPVASSHMATTRLTGLPSGLLEDVFASQHGRHMHATSQFHVTHILILGNLGPPTTLTSMYPKGMAMRIDITGH